MRYMPGIILSVALLIAPVVCAEPLLFERLTRTLTEPLPEQAARGEVTAIDLAARSIEISGYRYYMPAITNPAPLLVTLSGGRPGALQLLTIGMHTEILYIQVEDKRLAYEITQIAKTNPD